MPDAASILLRTDGHAGIGGGHVMRCLALAQAWREAGGRAAFAAAAVAPSLRQRLLNEGFLCHSIAAPPGTTADSVETAAIAGRCSAGAVVIDGYQFGYRFREALHAAGLVTAAIDDNGEVGRCVDSIIVNQNIHASGALYRYGEAKSTLLLGTDYVLMRREFRDSIRTSPRANGPVRRVLITLGQADRDNATGRVLASLRQLDMSGIETQVIVGGENPHLADIENACAALPGARAETDPGTGMANLMVRTDVAIVAGGSTMWELAAMGVPFVSIVVAENQRLAVSAMDALGFPTMTAANIEKQLPAKVKEIVVNTELRRSLGDTGRRLVDGQGASRVAREVFKRVCA